MKSFTLLVLLFSSIAMTTSCNSLAVKSDPENPRVITIDKKAYQENQYTSWRCYKNLLSTKVLVEVGRFNNQENNKGGFIIYEGGDTGEAIAYKRAGLNHRWDWNKVDGSYSYTLVIDPEGNGLYYDFSGSKNESSQEAKANYKCKK
tara:strand:- start:3585 stop:4025 length:441 start_codon:yes stop_codon:yes gene_type:complete